MNTVMNAFVKVLLYDFNAFRKGIILLLLAVLTSSILLGGLLGYGNRGGGTSEVILFGLMYELFGCIAASLMFVDMKNKQGRISQLMLPASSLIKFSARWIAVVPVLFILFWISFYLGDATRVLVHEYIFSPAFHTHVINPWETLCLIFYHNGISSFTMVSFIVSAYLFAQSSYILGAIIWPKLSFIKTLVALWIIETIIGFLIVSLKGLPYIDNTTFSTLLTVSWIAMTSFSMVLWWLTYILYKRSSVSSTCR